MYMQKQKRLGRTDMHTFYVALDEKKLEKEREEETAELFRDVGKQKDIDPQDKDTIEL